MDDDALVELDWVVWNLEVDDPDRLVRPGIGERTGPAMVEMAGSLGCVFVQCTDDDEVDEVPYYSWLVRVPQEEHLRRSGDGIPVVVAALHAYLRSQLPSQLRRWRVWPDQSLSLRDEAGRILRAAYADLLDPLEVALLGLRCEGAEGLDPTVHCWSADKQTLAGTYVMWLCEDPDASNGTPWLVLYAGLCVDTGFWSGPHGRQLQRSCVPEDSPVLLLPRTDSPRWLVTVTTAPFSTIPDKTQPAPVGASHRWTASDPVALANRISVDLRSLFTSLRLA